MIFLRMFVGVFLCLSRILFTGFGLRLFFTRGFVIHPYRHRFDSYWLDNRRFQIAFERFDQFLIVFMLFDRDAVIILI